MRDCLFPAMEDTMDTPFALFSLSSQLSFISSFHEYDAAVFSMYALLYDTGMISWVCFILPIMMVAMNIE